MADPCFDPEKFDELLDLPQGDPRKEHLAGCSACRSLLLAYRRFLDPSDLPNGAQPGPAGKELSRFLAEQLDKDSSEPSVPPFSSRLLAALTGPWLRPGLALVAVFLIIGVFWVNGDGPSLPGHSGVVRDLPAEDAMTWRLLPPARLEAGGLELAWEPYLEAESYRVQLLDASLLELGSFDSARAPRFEIGAASIAALTGEARFWRVLAISGGDEVARSGTRSLPR